MEKRIHPHRIIAHVSMPWAARDYVSLASQNSRTNARDGYTDVKKEPRGIAGNEYLCNKDSKKSLHFFLSKQKTKTVPSSPSHRQIMHLHTLRTAIKPTPADIPHITVMPVPPSRTTEKPFSHHRKARIATPKRLFRSTADTVLQHKNTHSFDCQHLTQTAQNPRIRVRNVFTTKISYSRGVVTE